VNITAHTVTPTSAASQNQRDGRGAIGPAYRSLPTQWWQVNKFVGS
jgi:hypothetical protein